MINKYKIISICYLNIYRSKKLFKLKIIFVHLNKVNNEILYEKLIIYNLNTTIVYKQY